MAARTTLLDEALDLPADERVELAVKLLESVDAQGSCRVSGAWGAEIGTRVGRALGGHAGAAAWSGARADPQSRRAAAPMIAIELDPEAEEGSRKRRSGTR